MEPIGASQPNRLHSMVDAVVMGTQALLNMISRGELIGVAVLIIIGIALIALAPTKQPGDRMSAVAV